MADNILRTKSFYFAVQIVDLYKYLTTNKKEFVLSKQLLRSGTSIGANVEEAIGGQSEADFMSKLSIAYKEARETSYWIKLLVSTYFKKNEMKHKSILVTFSILLTCLSLLSCKKDKDETSDDDKFCEFVNSQNYEATGPLIDNFLATLDNNNQDENLGKLKDWMEAKSCVDSTMILCNSCIETNPAQSELRVIFISNGQKTSKIMDIIMSDPLKFRTYHEGK